jgi:hypothetical protein
MLTKLDPDQRWGGLSRTLTPKGLNCTYVRSRGRLATGSPHRDSHVPDLVCGVPNDHRYPRLEKTKSDAVLWRIRCMAGTLIA